MSGLVKIIKYEGRAGGFATQDSTLYRTDVTGLDGSTRYGNHYKELKYAEADADKWKNFTGFPVVRVEMIKIYKEVEKEVESFT